jgi:hypothetical protein
MSKLVLLVRTFCLGLIFFTASSLVQAQSTSFTYQGALSDGGTLANGNYDLQFSLWDGGSGGTQIGSTQTQNAVQVSNGIFSVTLDFGANAFSGGARFLEISTRPAGVGSLTLLSPRQPVTSTPYAIRSLSSTTANTATDATQLGGTPASQFVQTTDARLSDPRPPTPNSSSYIQNTSTQQSANFSISGSGTTGGTLSGNILNATTQFNLNGTRVLHAPGTGNLFGGASAGAANTTGQRNSFFGTLAG